MGHAPVRGLVPRSQRLASSACDGTRGETKKYAAVLELVDRQDLGSCGRLRLCGFESHPRHCALK